jgi:hypothetical protein
MGQMLLIPDPKPLDERLGQKFFRKAPKRPGVYLMRDAEDNVLYVGKAKNLQQRLRNYRIANPDRCPGVTWDAASGRIEFRFVLANLPPSNVNPNRFVRSSPIQSCRCSG